MLLTIISILIISTYILLIITFIIGWIRIPEFHINSGKNEIKISIIVACKNEENNVQLLLKALQNQSFNDFELILINDHSADTTLQIMENALSVFHNIKVINAVGCGKKNALKEGVLLAQGDLIITTDADCVPGKKWIETVLKYYNNKHYDLIVCPVKMESNNSFFSKLQTIEFTSLIASGAGAIGAGIPILCNGANLAFKKSAWLESQTDLNEIEISGDDIFLLLSIKKRGGKIGFLKSQEAIVETKASSTISAFFKQRTRWASKSSSYTDLHIIFTAVIVFIVSCLQLILLALIVAGNPITTLFFFVFFFKLIVDSVFLLIVKDFFGLGSVLLYSLLLSFIYPFYIVIVALKSLVFKPKLW